MHGKKGDPGHAQALAGPLIVGIGASAGGLEAVREMLAHAEPGMDMAFVLIQHLDPNHESLLAELIGRQTKLAVMQVSGDIKVDADHVYVIPPGSGLELKDGVLSLVSFRERRGMRRPIDDFFISLAGDQGSNAVCVVMSGTGADGAIGLRAIKENGGVAVAQEPSSAKYDSMPLAAVATGLVDFVLEPVQRRAAGLALFRCHAAQFLHHAADLALLAKGGKAHLLQRVGIGGTFASARVATGGGAA